MANNPAKNQTPTQQGSFELEGGPAHNLHVQMQRPMQPGFGAHRGPMGVSPEHPYSSPAFEPLLPEDDMARFFHNRAAVNRHANEVSNIVIAMMAMLLLAAGCLVTYNYRPKFRQQADAAAKQWIGLDLNAYVPKIGPRAKAFREERRKELELISQPVMGLQGVVSSIAADSAFIQARKGQWQAFGSDTLKRCPRWAATRACALTGFYYVHRGALQNLSSMQAIPRPQVTSLQTEEQALWDLSLAVAQRDRLKRESVFRRGLDLVPAKSVELRKVMFDEMIVNLARLSDWPEVQKYLAWAKKDGAGKLWQNEYLKWKALASLGSPGRAQSETLFTLMQQQGATLRSDPVSIELLAPAMMRAGYAVAYLRVIAQALEEAKTWHADLEAQRGLYRMRVRLLWAAGRRGEASTALARYQDLYGRDAIAAHYQAALTLLKPNPKTARQVMESLKASRSWDSMYLYSYAALTAGQHAVATDTLKTLKTAAQRGDRAVWVRVLEAEILLAKRQYAAAERMAKPLISSRNLNIRAADVSWKALQGLGRDKEAMDLRLKIDDVRSKTGYWSSPEMLGSPFGPLALTKL